MEVKQWITVHPNGADSKGQPIPVMEGQSKGEAVKAFVNKHQKEVDALKNKSTDELKAKAVKNTESKQPDDGSFEIEDKENGKKHSYYQKDGKYYADYYESYGGQSKKLGTDELSKDEYVAGKLSKTMDALAINYNDWDYADEGGKGYIAFSFDNDNDKNNAFKKLYGAIGEEREIRNYKDGIYVSVDNLQERTEKHNAKRDEYVVNAIKSGKYKGTPKEIARKIFEDSPYSIHSAGAIADIVRRELGVKEKFSI